MNPNVRTVSQPSKSANCDCDFQAEFCDNFRRDKVRAKAKEEVATSEEVTSVHAVKPSPVAVLRGRQP